jgi:hypothetical protein
MLTFLLWKLIDVYFAKDCKKFAETERDIRFLRKQKMELPSTQTEIYR